MMVLGAIGSYGKKCPIIFVDTDEKIYRIVYEGLLDRPVILWVKATYLEGNFTFQLDGAPDHKIAVGQAKLTKEVGGLLRNPTSACSIMASAASFRMMSWIPLTLTLSR